MARHGFNAVRVFLNGSRGRRGCLVAEPDDDGLSGAYLDNLTDFLLKGLENGILTVPCFELMPETGPYRAGLGERVENVGRFNNHYLNPAFIQTKVRYISDVIRGIAARAPQALEAVLCWDVMNELCYALGEPPFSLETGSVTPANGVTYDLTKDKARLADDMAVHWVDAMADAVRAEIPDALVNANVFTYRAVGRTGVGDFHQDPAGWKNRYPFRPLALLQSKADVIDVHLYCADRAELARDLDSIEHGKLMEGMLTQPGKVAIVGEFGAFINPFPDVNRAAAWMGELAHQAIPEHGFAGWLHWTYDCDEQTELWNAMSRNGAILKALSVGP
jgi:hypothetical protein